MTYYYYDKVLVSNCRLKNLNSYAGKMKSDSVIQLSAILVEEDDAILADSGEVSLAEDFYQIGFEGRITYRIHKGGNLIRAYTVDYSWIEQTIACVPASILAVIHGKILLKGSLLHARDWAYALIGDRGTADSGDEAVMILAHDSEYTGIVHFYQYEMDSGIEAGIEALELMGIFVMRKDEEATDAIVPIEAPELKKKALLENVIGYELLPQDLKQKLQNSPILEGLSRDLYMASMLVRQRLYNARERID